MHPVELSGELLLMDTLLSQFFVQHPEHAAFVVVQGLNLRVGHKVPPKPFRGCHDSAD
jgi:hypothetical protein